jgi:histidinol-phosphate/aromatic aminotransferase/cobyric acid decarboxylase-like protein/adenosyl cobinamide kinase/adenosyl cobinamide phosphate guanylyltransferase
MAPSAPLPEGVVLVVGGTRSGKSAFAESLLAGAGTVAYLATASATDAEMAARIAAHRRRRPAAWTTIEVAADPLVALDAAGDRAVLLDGLGGWIAGELHRAGVFDRPERLGDVADRLRAQLRAVAAAAAERPAPTIVVVEDAGSAPVAADRATRGWVDLLGEAAQALSAVARQAFLIVAGRAVDLPRASTRRPATCVPAARPLHGDRMVPSGHEDYAVSVVAGGPPEWLAAALRAALAGGASTYPDDRAAVAAVASRHGRDPADVLVLNGAAEGFWLLAEALDPHRAVVLGPAFTEGATALRARGAEPHLVPRDARDGFALHPETVPDDADLVLVANPCNPTGALHPADAVLRLARPGRTIIVDEAFMDLVPGEPESLAFRGRLPGVVILRSLTKSLGIPGLRVGYLLGDPELVERLAARRQPWAVNALALAALRAWAQRERPTAALAEQIAVERTALTAALEGLPGVTVHPGAANFLLVRVPEGERVRAALAAERIAVRPTTDLGLDADHLRVAVRDRSANQRLVAALVAVLARDPVARR